MIISYPQVLSTDRIWYHKVKCFCWESLASDCFIVLHSWCWNGYTAHSNIRILVGNGAQIRHPTVGFESVSYMVSEQKRYTSFRRPDPSLSLIKRPWPLCLRVLDSGHICKDYPSYKELRTLLPVLIRKTKNAEAERSAWKLRGQEMAEYRRENVCYKFSE